MQDYEKYINQIKEKFKKYNPYKIFLFGSCVTGKIHKDSDIDILVVTKDEYMPKNFKEKTQLYLKFRESITEINKEIAIDLIVYTLPMFQKFIELGSSFADEIKNNAKIIYESYNTKMA